MKILVCLKQVVDVELNIQLKDGQIADQGLRYVINAYDESALEAALQLKDAADADVTVLSIGPDRVLEALRKGLSMGADRAIHLKDDAFNGSDSYAFGKAISELVKQRGYDLVVMGKQAQDTDAAQGGPMLAEFLDWPQATNLIFVQRSPEGGLLVRRVGDDGKEVLTVQTPAVLTISNDFGEARIPTMKGIMGAKKKEIETLSFASIGVAADAVGVAGSRTEIVNREQPEGRKTGRKVTGEVGPITRELVNWLVNDGKLPV
jgi:electron transfer flavoprotein beta subunit